MRGASGIAFDYASRARCRRGSHAGQPNRRLRIGLIYGAAFLWSGVLVWRLFTIQIYRPDFWRSSAAKQHVSEIKLASERGPIFDRNDQLLAVSVPAGSVYARPQEVRDKALAARQLAQALQIPRADVERALVRRQPFVWIKRQIPKVHAERAAALGLPGVGYLLESRRFYPYNQAGSALIGKVGIDGSGLSGLEALYDRRLSGEQFRTTVMRDALGHAIENVEGPPEGFHPPKGSALRLTIDAAMQMIVDEELEAGRAAAASKGALGVLIDAATGEVLAMGQAPGYNFNEDQVQSRRDMVNRVVETVFEPGSIMKPIVASAALDAGLIKNEEIINCENGRYKFGRHTIKDVHPYSLLSLHDVVVRSSNIGMTKVGVRLGADRLHDALRRFGFGQPIGLGLPGETRGILRGRQDWATVDVATHAFGQGVAVTALHMVRALSAIVNDGELPALQVVKSGERSGAVRVVSSEAAAAVREMMYDVVEDEHGTGRKAAINGVRVGGKTGTAQKARAGARGYASGLYMASFMGFVDATQIGLSDKLALIVVIDEPHTSIYGGSVAAPVFQKILKRVLHLLATRNELRVPLDKDENEDTLSLDDEDGAGLLPVAYQP